jgi:hypothetical protein
VFCILLTRAVRSLLRGLLDRSQRYRVPFLKIVINDAFSKRTSMEEHIFLTVVRSNEPETAVSETCNFACHRLYLMNNYKTFTRHPLNFFHENCLGGVTALFALK